MRTGLFLNGKRTTKKNVLELVGQSRLDKMIKEAKETWLEDRFIQLDYYIGRGQMLTIEFS